MNVHKVTIRKSSVKDAQIVSEIYDKARAFMRSTGNSHQWNNDYPSLNTFESDISEGNSYVLEQSDRIIASFYFREGTEPTYARIYGGEWLNDCPYGVIHRAASDGTVKGVMKMILDYCLSRCHNIRIDTHRDNSVMQNALYRYGFTYCGIIRLANGDERLAYQYANEPKTAHGSDIQAKSVK